MREQSANYRGTLHPSLNRQRPAPLRNAAWGGMIDHCDIHSVGASGRRRTLNQPGAKQFYAGR